MINAGHSNEKNYLAQLKTDKYRKICHITEIIMYGHYATLTQM